MTLYTLVLGELQTNCYIWADSVTGNALVVDVPDNAARIAAFAEEKGLKITDIVLTHGHFDHMMALAELKGITGARVSVFEKTVMFMKEAHLNLAGHMGMRCEYIEADNVLSDGDEIDFFGNKIKVMHTPGHTEDSICLLFGDTLISGDTLFRRSVGRWDFPTGDMHKEINSIKEILFKLPDETKVYPGHGAATTIGEERRGNPYAI